MVTLFYHSVCPVLQEFSFTHIPGIQNMAADRASRFFNDRTEWALTQVAFDAINLHLGPLHIDLFASTANKKLPVFMSWHPDPDCWSVDAFTVSW